MRKGSAITTLLSVRVFPDWAGKEPHSRVLRCGRSSRRRLSRAPALKSAQGRRPTSAVRLAPAAGALMPGGDVGVLAESPGAAGAAPSLGDLSARKAVASW